MLKCSQLCCDSVKRDKWTTIIAPHQIGVISFFLQLSTLVVLAMLLLLAGDVERNPGPLRGLDVTTLARELSPAKDKWHEIGVQLEIKLSQLSDIEDMHHSSERRMTEMLAFWLDGNTKTPICWESILKCLRSPTVNKRGLAEELQEKYCQPQNGPGALIRRWCTLSRWQVIVAALVCIVGFLWMYFPMLYYQFNLLHSKSLPYLSDNFVGRHQEMQDLLELLNFKQSNVRIVNVIGSPGFGKSTLAVHVGHKLTEMGVIVHYVNMGENEILDQSVDQLLAEKILQSSGTIAKRVTFSRLEKWAQERYSYNLIILDNCDDALNQQKDTFQTAVEKLVKNSQKVKVLMTSREVTIFLSYFRSYNLYELSTKAACQLLKLILQETIEVWQQETIANLTGNVPLALEIISSLLEMQASLGPDTIIAELEKEPITVLSPKELHSSLQINASITLSYKYLSQELRIAGQFYANFPGSFTEIAAYGVHVLSDMNSWTNQTNLPFSHDVVQKELSSLVRRSLLGYNKRTGRYQFHRLIREYFLDVQKLSDTHLTDIKIFRAGFYIYYSLKMMNLSDNFLTDQFVKSLISFDTERHNFQLLLEYLKDTNLLHRRAFVFVVTAVARTLDSGLLFCRLSCEDVMEPLKNSLEFFRKHSKLFSRFFQNYHEMISASEFSKFLFSVVSKLAECKSHASQNETEVKLNVLLENRDLFDQESESPGYAMLHETLALIYSQLGLEEDHLESHRIILEHTKKQIVDCEPGKCNYFAIGQAYMFSGDSHKAVGFLERSLEQTEEYSTLNRVGILSTLHDQYSQLTDKKMILETKSRVEALLAEEFLSIPDIDFYRCSCMTVLIIKKLREFSLDSQALQLQGKLLQVYRTINVPPEETVPLQEAYMVVKDLYDSGNYTSVVDLGQFTLNSFLNNTSKEEIENLEQSVLEFKLLIGEAKYHGGNYSKGLNDIEEVLIKVFAQQTPNEELVRSACWYLFLPQLQFSKYIYKCYVPTISDKLLSIPLVVSKFVLQILFSPIVEVRFRSEIADKKTQSLNKITVPPTPTSIKPEISFLSSSTDLSISQSGNELADFLESRLFSPAYTNVVKYPLHFFLKLLRYVNHVFKTLTENLIFRVVINVLSIWVRLIIAFYIIIFFVSYQEKEAMVIHCCFRLIEYRNNTNFFLACIRLYGISFTRCAIRIIRDPRYDLMILAS